MFAHLDEAGAELTDDLIASDDLIHCFTITVRAAQRTRRNEKIRLFARLLASATKGDDITDVDEYEELLGILDEMSLREIHVLTILERFERGDPTDAEAQGTTTRPSDASSYWPAFADEVERLANVRPDETKALLARLNRTGLYSSMDGTWGNMSGRGNLTPRYYRLRALIADADGNVIGDSHIDRNTGR